MSKVGTTLERRGAYRGRLRTQQEVQTEATFVPGCRELNYAYDPLASEQYEHLMELRQMIHSCLTMVAGDVYDVVTFKDILFELESQLPSSLPVTDLLLLASRLFRRTSELGRLLSCFFGVVFADDHDDEHFHFTEVRLLQREVRELKRQLESSDQERAKMQEKLDNVGQIAYDHGKAVELLETHNRVLKTQTTALEDQMALLFHQLNTGLETHCQDAYKQVSSEMKVQEDLNPTRITFRQTVDSLSEQLRSSRGLITEVREVLLSCSQGARTGENYVAVEPSVRFKLKMLDSNFQQLMGRFGAIKDTVVETAQELMNALQERKKILYLSFQHIRLYDLQNTKTRNARAILTQLHHNTSEFVQRMNLTFPDGALTSVDRFGNITSQRWQGGYTLAALRGFNLNESESGEAGKSSSTQSGRFLPGMTEAHLMAAANELAALEGRSQMTATTSAAVGGKETSSQAPSKGSPAEKPFRDVEGRGRSPSPQKTKPKRTAAERVEATAAAPDNVDGEVVAYDSTKSFLDLLHRIDADTEELEGMLELDDEMSAFLKMLTLSASTTPRADLLDSSGAGWRASQLERQQLHMEAALGPTGNGLTGGRANPMTPPAHTYGDAGIIGTSPSRARSPNSPEPSGRTSPRADNAQSEAALARTATQLQRQQEQMVKMQEDFASKVAFLRQVYEARINDLEVREMAVGQRLNVAGVVASGAEGPSTSSAGAGGRKGKGEEGRAGRAPPGDKEHLLKARKDWQQTKPRMQPNQKLREAAMKELQRNDDDEEQR